MASTPLTRHERTIAADILRGASGEHLRAPLWDWPPDWRPLVLHERRRRGLLTDDPEPTGDHEYA